MLCTCNLIVIVLSVKKFIILRKGGQRKFFGQIRLLKILGRENLFPVRQNPANRKRYQFPAVSGPAAKISDRSVLGTNNQGASPMETRTKFLHRIHCPKVY